MTNLHAYLKRSDNETTITKTSPNSMSNEVVLGTTGP